MRTIPIPFRRSAAQGEMGRHLRSWLTLVAASVVLDLAIVATYFHLAPRELQGVLSLSFPLSFKNWLMWAAFAPFILWVAHRMVARRGSGGRRVAVSLGVVVLFAVAHAVIELFIKGVELHHAGAGAFLSYHTWHGFTTAGVLYAVALGIESDRAARAREMREVQLHEQVSRAQLDTLRMQLQPHFLFNTLNSISALVEDDVPAGQRMIGRLSDFLRLTLSGAAHAEVPLREELALLRHYLEIQETRFQDRLRVEVEVEPGAERALVPNLVLQPLVENAIRHGIQPSLGGGTITVRARREGECLWVEVLDDGVGLPEGFAPEQATGIGLANTRLRLRECFGEGPAFTIERREPSGTRVALRLPWREAPAGAPA